MAKNEPLNESLEVRQYMIVDGSRLEIIASRILDEEWELSVENEYGIRSVWCEFFESAEDALKAGRKAINDEGAEPFNKIEDFGFLFDQ